MLKYVIPNQFILCITRDSHVREIISNRIQYDCDHKYSNVYI